MSPDPAGLAVADPSNPQTWNRYAYVMNSPLSFIDPTGLACYPLERAMFGSCAGFEGNGVSFGESSNEFDLMSIPIVTTAWGWVANSPGSGVSAPFNLMVSNTQVLAYWGQVTMQVGTGFDLLSGYCALFCGANGNNLFNKLYPLQALPTSTASNPPQPTVGDAEATCAVDAANANNGLGLYNNLPASGTESNSTGVVYSMETNHGFQPMNPSAEPAANAAQAFAPPGIFFSASVSNCMLDRAK